MGSNLFEPTDVPNFPADQKVKASRAVFDEKFELIRQNLASLASALTAVTSEEFAAYDEAEQANYLVTATVLSGLMSDATTGGKSNVIATNKAVTDLSSAINGKASNSALATTNQSITDLSNSVNSSISSINSSINSLNSALSGKSDTNHTHGDLASITHTHTLNGLGIYYGTVSMASSSETTFDVGARVLGAVCVFNSTADLDSACGCTWSGQNLTIRNSSGAGTNISWIALTH